MALINCPDCGRQVSDAAPACPHCGRPIAPTASTSPPPDAPAAEKKSGGCGPGCLAALGVLVVLGLIGQATGSRTPAGSSTYTASNAPTAYTPPPAPAGPVLELVDFSWSREYGYATLKGRVKNVSAAPLKNVQAVATFTDRDGGLVTSDDALIEYNPVLPGQTSPFTVMARDNPAMRSASVEFKEMFGGTLETSYPEPKKRNK